MNAYSRMGHCIALRLMHTHGKLSLALGRRKMIEGGERVQGTILLSSGSDIDIMVHGLFSYELFGHTFWITTTHVSLLIVILVLTGF